MFWHIVKFRFGPDAGDAERQQCEAEVVGMQAEIEEIRFVRIARSVDEPDVSGLVMGFDDEVGFKAYNANPAHIPVARRIDGLCSEVVRVDMVTDDDPASFPG